MRLSWITRRNNIHSHRIIHFLGPLPTASLVRALQQSFLIALKRNWNILESNYGNPTSNRITAWTDCWMDSYNEEISYSTSREFFFFFFLFTKNKVNNGQKLYRSLRSINFPESLYFASLIKKIATRASQLPVRIAYTFSCAIFNVFTTCYRFVCSEAYNGNREKR